jgi:hypothetical protein
LNSTSIKNVYKLRNFAIVNLCYSTHEFPSSIRLPAKGDQPQAIEKLTQGIIDGEKFKH